MFKFQIRSVSLITIIPYSVTTGINGLSGRFSRRRLRCRFLSLRIFAFCQPGSISLPFRLTETRTYYQKNAAQSTRLASCCWSSGLFWPCLLRLANWRGGPSAVFYFFYVFFPVFVRYSLCAFFVLFAHFG